MFADLKDTKIKPEEIEIVSVPEVKLSENLRTRIKEMLKAEEGLYTVVFEKTGIVQNDKNYVFFSNQWLYLAVICKEFALALYTYCDFFDNTIRPNATLLNCFKTENYSEKNIIKAFESESDIERMAWFIKGNSDFRPGKALFNGDKIRSCKDIFGSCVLSKLAVPNASSDYLGNIIFYLAKRPDLFTQLETEILDQSQQNNPANQLPDGVKDCAKSIIDCIYRIDKLKKIKSIIEINDKNIKINTSSLEGNAAKGNFLRYVFARPNSDLYNTQGSAKTRVFTDTTYGFDINGINEKCRLTTEWVDTDINQSGNGNYLRALIEVVNTYYEGIVKITEKSGKRYMFIMKNHFDISSLPTDFSSRFAKRYISSLLAKPFVILTGNSGTGKTRIAKQFAEYLEIDIKGEGKNWELVPVGADWTDNTKILGFFNPLANEGKGEYVKTRIVRFIENANNNKDIPFFLILDEMNLSHVERYFSDFLSHMETPEISFVLDGYKGNLEYPSNLFVVGTVNIDETTYMFSPKVLDRANVIEFKPDKDTVLNLFLNPVSQGKINAVKDGTAELFLKLANEIRLGKCDNNIEMERVKDLFEAIYEIIEKSGYEFAYRTVKEIRQYISAAYELEEEKGSFNLALIEDEQVLQKILPKIHGNRKEIGELLIELESICEKNNLKFSQEKILQMKGKLVKSQYASFI